LPAHLFTANFSQFPEASHWDFGCG
jgi:hypothetical protein